MGRPKKVKELDLEKVEVSINDDDKKVILIPEKVSAEIKQEKPDPRKSARDLALAQIEKDFGKGSIMSLGSYGDNNPVQHVSTGSLKVDMILGKGGFCFGRIIELFGPPASGKSTLTLSVIANAQKFGMRCAYIDKEHAMDPDYAKTMGVNLDDLYLSQPDTGEQALSIIETLVKSGAFDIIVLDSVAALNPKEDLEKDYEDNAKMAGKAAMLTRFFDRITGPVAENKVMLFCINQLRAGLSPYGPKETTGGGYAIKHYCSQRVEIRAQEKLTDKDGVIYGNTVKVKTAKNRLNVPYKETNFNLIFGTGIDKYKDLLDIGVEVGVIKKEGNTWVQYGEEKFQGEPKFKEACLERPDLFNEIRLKVVELIGPEWGPEGKS